MHGSFVLLRIPKPGAIRPRTNKLTKFIQVHTKFSANFQVGFVLEMSFAEYYRTFFEFRERSNYMQKL